MINTFILCGGSGERFDGDKCRQRFGDSTVLETVVDAAVEPILVVGDTERFSWMDPSVPFLVDRYPGAGPAAAITQVIEHARRRHFEMIRVVSCDMPTVDPAWWKLLEATDAPAAAFHDGTHWQPLISIFRPAEVEIDGDWKDEPAWKLMEAIGASRVDPPANWSQFVSINTREDLKRAQAIFAEAQYEE